MHDHVGGLDAFDDAYGFERPLGRRLHRSDLNHGEFTQRPELSDSGVIRSHRIGQLRLARRGPECRRLRCVGNATRILRLSLRDCRMGRTFGVGHT
eukprot:2044898-Pleurochrysis_carterae.AAC.2